ncbi:MULTISPECIES: IS630 family transposase [Dickeya]|uniref:IS630 family transposase n=1 Tax=Dickeya TaxID=204037 RepID=UPI0021F57C5E|nr:MULTISPECIES: IS630 family transposase [Dickeya]
MPTGCPKGSRSVSPRRDRTRNIIWPALCIRGRAESHVSGNSKSYDLFIKLLEALRRIYRRAKTITLVVDNYIIHKSHKVERWLAENSKFRLLFLPTYSPWLNPIERLWLSLHETITRNHQCQYLWQLLKQVTQFMRTASPFPGNQPGLAKVEQ